MKRQLWTYMDTFTENCYLQIWAPSCGKGKMTRKNQDSKGPSTNKEMAPCAFCNCDRLETPVCLQLSFLFNENAYSSYVISIPLFCMSSVRGTDSLSLKIPVLKIEWDGTQEAVPKKTQWGVSPTSRPNLDDKCLGCWCLMRMRLRESVGVFYMGGGCKLL